MLGIHRQIACDGNKTGCQLTWLREALINSSLNYQSTRKNSILEKMRFLFCFIFNDLQSLKMAAPPFAAETLNNSEFP